MSAPAPTVEEAIQAALATVDDVLDHSLPPDWRDRDVLDDQVIQP